KDARYKEALKKFIARYADHETAAMARYLAAIACQREGERAEAHSLATQAVNTFPKSPGGRLCFNLIQASEIKFLSVGTERVWADPWPVIHIHYRNVTQANFRLIREDWSARLKAGRYRPEQLDHNERQALLAKKPERSWSVQLPPTKDFQPKTK